MNKLEITPTENYLLVVSDNTPHKGYEGYYYLGNKIFNTNKYVLQTGCKSITHYYPLNGAPDLEGVDKLDDLVDEVNSYCNNVLKNGLTIDNVKQHYTIAQMSQIYGLMYNAYKAATKTYSEEDLREAVKLARISAVHDEETDSYSLLSADGIIQSLNKPKYPKYFIAETQSIYSKEFFDVEEGIIEYLTTTNSKGQIVLKGEWVYE